MIICVNFIARVTAIVRNPTVLLLSTLKYEPGVNPVFGSIWKEKFLLVLTYLYHLIIYRVQLFINITPDLIDN